MASNPNPINRNIEKYQFIPLSLSEGVIEELQ